MHRILIISLATLIGASSLVHTTSGKEATAFYQHQPGEERPAWLRKAREKAQDAGLYVNGKNFNNSVVFLLDMSIPSGRERFFVYHLKKDSIIYSGLVTHGSCNSLFLEGRKYSNVEGSGCTSLGKYKIGKSYHGQYGLAWKLYGLEKSNSNAYKRYVVLHSHSCVPDQEMDDELCQSLGCPTVSPNFLKTIKPILDKSDKPVLMWIYE